MKDGTYRSQIVRVISMAVETGKPNRRISSLAGDLAFPVARVGCNLVLRVRRRLDPSGVSFTLLGWCIRLHSESRFHGVLIYIGLPWNYSVVIYPLAL